MATSTRTEPAALPRAGHRLAAVMAWRPSVRIVVAAAATVAWDLQDETGAPIPISADTIGQLSGEGAAPFALWIDRVLAPGFAAWVSTLAS